MVASWLVHLSSPRLSGPGSISDRGHCLCSWAKKRDKCQPDGLLGSYADLTFIFRIQFNKLYTWVESQTL